MSHRADCSIASPSPRCAVCLDKVNACRDPRSGHWNTTHDNALAINALVAHAAAQGPEEREPVVSASLAVLTGGKQETVVFPQGASATWKFLKNKARIKLELNDILNAKDGKYISQSAYQQTITRRDFRHHYISLSFTYHLDAKTKE